MVFSRPHRYLLYQNSVGRIREFLVAAPAPALTQCTKTDANLSCLFILFNALGKGAIRVATLYVYIFYYSML